MHLRILLLLPLLFVMAGCLLPNAGKHRIRFEPEKRYVAYGMEFSEAYAAPSEQGGYDLVLAEHVYTPAGSAKVTQASSRDLSQVLHLHVAWRPERNSKSDFPAATNSTARWVITTGPDWENYLEYAGIGFVKVELGTNESVFELKDVTVNPQSGRGALGDSFGKTRIFGSVHAKHDKRAVSDILRRLQQLPTAPAPSPATRPNVKIAEPAGMAPARNVNP